MTCIFCKIVAGEIPCHRVYDDEHVLAFLDVAPLERGHALVIPREHHVLFEDMPGETQAAFMRAVAKIATAARRATGASATTLAVNNGAAAGQEVPHCHMHVIPRRSGDGGGSIHALFTRHAETEDVVELAQAMQEALA